MYIGGPRWGDWLIPLEFEVELEALDGLENAGQVLEVKDVDIFTTSVCTRRGSCSLCLFDGPRSQLCGAFRIDFRRIGLALDCLHRSLSCRR